MSSSASLPPAVDEEFEAVATQVLKRTQSMVNKYRRLLLVEAEVRPPLATTLGAHMHSCRHSYTGCPLPPSYFRPQRFSPSSEMVMIDRTFNQEERSNLTQDKRMVLVDPGKERERSEGSERVHKGVVLIYGGIFEGSHHLIRFLRSRFHSKSILNSKDSRFNS